MKKVLSFVVILIATLSCNDTQTDKHSKRVPITIIGENSASIQALMALKSDFENKNPTIELVFKPNTFDDAFNKSNQDFANNTGLYDIIMQYNFSLSSFVRNKYIYPLDKLITNIPDSLKTFEQDFFPNAWKEVGFYYKDPAQTNNELSKVGYPFACNSMILMCNKEIFDDEKQKADFKKKFGRELRMPTTWDEFYQVSVFFKQPQNNTFGVCLEGATGSWLYYEWMNFLYGMGGKIFDKQYGWEGNENSKLLLNSPEALKALKFYKSLKPYNAGGFTNVEQFEQMKIMKEGKTAMAIVWSDVIYPSIFQKDHYDGRFEFAPIPGSKSVLAGGAFFINKNTKEPDKVAQYLIYLMQPSTQVELAKKGLSSGSRRTYDDTEVKKIPYSSALYNSLLRGGVILEAGPDANVISEKITTYIQKYWNDEISAEEALKKMESEILTERKRIFASMK